MIIEIRKAGFVNKGAELMLRAIKEKVLLKFPASRIVVAPTPSHGTRPFNKIAKEGFYLKASLYRYGFDWGRVASLAPRKLREMYGVVLDREVDVVLDAAGFSYSDQWGIGHTKELAHAVKRWRKQGTTIILMPQAFGPYEGTIHRKLIAKVVKDVDLVMPRDSVSLRNLEDVVGSTSNICRFPDFTNLLVGRRPDDLIIQKCAYVLFQIIE
ncbi:polysaccharide pyruvyl transferase family protein [Alkalilimnicola ehrlichii]|uniref:polysaccharide pyruvyl transferase family protein n=1 Tax=Alkalilimnicola ehrlichii TaxID=351052 RepID=UPI0021611281|nr:polysaccharide pyruvyl transferase family protein [Alkalilimnicola ehrlichii]